MQEGGLRGAGGKVIGRGRAGSGEKSSADSTEVPGSSVVGVIYVGVRESVRAWKNYVKVLSLFLLFGRGLGRVGRCLLD